jgi:orotidine-5'-phosphate decarboxylase
VTDSFATRFARARARFGPLTWGLDPAGELLESWGLGDTPDGLDRFADLMTEAVSGVVGLVKPQSAFYERHGWRGIRTLSRLLADVRAQGVLAVLDAKRGDVGSTNVAYAEAFLGPGAPLEADAVTVHPYLGFGAMDPFVTRAHQSGACLLVVTRSTNPEGRLVQAALAGGPDRGAPGGGGSGAGGLGVSEFGAGGPRVDGASVEQALLAEIGRVNAALAPGEIGPVGAVVGPGYLEPPLDLATANALFLAPGLGAQGATCADVARTFAACPDRVLPSASRSLLAAGPELPALRDAALALAAELAAVLP